MLLALTGKMPEALLAMSNAIDVAKSKQTDDPLALARAYDAMGRTLIEMHEVEKGLVTLQTALCEFSKLADKCSVEINSTNELIKKFRASGGK